ncbi:MAG: hypothetical protein ACP5FT_04210 [Acidilobus sp.]
MPVELYTLEEALKVAPKAIECRVKRTTRDGKAKIKLRTKRYLYTLKVEPSQVDEVLSKLGCKNVVDIDAEIAKRKKERAEAKKAEKKKAEEKAEKPSAPKEAQQAQPQPPQPQGGQAPSQEASSQAQSESKAEQEGKGS